MSDFFPYGQILPPQFRFGALERGGYCVTKEELDRIEKHPLSVPESTWVLRRRYCSGQRRTCRGIIVLKALLWDCEWWWRVRLFDELTEEYSDLCVAFTEYAAVFPSHTSAIAAAELFCSGHHWESAPFVWMDRKNEWRFVKAIRRSKRKARARVPSARECRQSRRRALRRPIEDPVRLAGAHPMSLKAAPRSPATSP
jgi:hypothetical protein